MAQHQPVTQSAVGPREVEAKDQTQEEPPQARALQTAQLAALRLQVSKLERELAHVKHGRAIGRTTSAVPGAAHTVPQRQQFSPLFSDRAANWFQESFGDALREISATLRNVYNAKGGTCIIPGAGSYGMEAVAREFGQDRTCLALRHGYFSYRWSEIFQIGRIPSKEVVVCALPDSQQPPQWAPTPCDAIVAKIHAERPVLVCAPHVETSTGIMLPDEYVKAIGAATREVGGFFALDCIASGNMWCDMEELLIDAIITAPQKGWTGPACCGIVMLNERARAHVHTADQQPAVGSYCCNLRKWVEVMDVYEDGGCTDHTTLPTDALMTFRDVVLETATFGFANCKANMAELGRQMRAELASRGFRSVAAHGFDAPGVVVSYAKPPLSSGASVGSNALALVEALKAKGTQIAGGVPFQLEERLVGVVDSSACTFRVGLFGLDKVMDPRGAATRFLQVLDAVLVDDIGKTSDARRTAVAKL